MAMSALRSSCSASSPGREQATPMLAEASVSRPSSSSGWLNAAVMGAAMR
jgi:hypothetical protein